MNAKEVRMKRFKKIIFLLFIISLLSAFIVTAADYKYVGSKNSDKYHYPFCSAARRILPKNLVVFKSAQEALNAYYVPCKICKPPMKD